MKAAYRQLFRLAGQISCNSVPVKQAIEGYGITAAKIAAIPAFSRQHLNFRAAPLAAEIEDFLALHSITFFCYVSFRPEYGLPMLREAMAKFRRDNPGAGFVWLGFPAKEMPAASEYVSQWPEHERRGLLLLGNLPHPEFLTLLSHCFAYIRTPMCDGVASSVLESLALGIPVVASDNGSRPRGAVTYRDNDEADLRAKLAMVVERYQQIKQQTRLEGVDDNVERTVDWLLGESPIQPAKRPTELIHAR
jgi:glycosyltransferase involved in cell wall biosynthesis